METRSGRIIQIIVLMFSFVAVRLLAGPAAKSNKTPVSALPNFAISEFYWWYEPDDDPEEDNRRCEVKMYAEFWSNDAQFTGEFEVGIYLSTDSNITTGDHLLTEDTAEFYGFDRVDREFVLTGHLYNNTIPFNPDKKHYLGIIIDHHNLIEESDETDNSGVYSEKIIIECISDLSVSLRQVSFDPETCLLGARAYVRNNAPMHNYLADYSVGLYLSEDKQITVDDLRIGSNELFLVPEAHVGLEIAEAQVDISTLFDDPDFDGTESYYVGWIVDDRDVIEEFDESNNTAVSSDALVKCSPPLPNLTLDLDHSDFEFDEESCLLTLSARVINTGDAQASESRLGYYLSTDNSIRTDDFFIGSNQARSLAPGDFDDLRFSVIIDTFTLEPPFDINGTYFAGWIVDDRGRIDESNEKDNRFSIDETITCNSAPGCAVWPGDANNDGTVNAADVLWIGLNYGTTGAERTTVSNSWTEQQTDCWESKLATYADCNGDGIVDVADVLAIGLNFGKTHSMSSVHSSHNEKARKLLLRAFRWQNR